VKHRTKELIHKTSRLKEKESIKPLVSIADETEFLRLTNQTGKSTTDNQRESRFSILANAAAAFVSRQSENVNKLTGDKVADDIIKSAEVPVVAGTACEGIVFTCVIQDVHLGVE
jgi:hypothetical protein